MLIYILWAVGARSVGSNSSSIDAVTRSLRLLCLDRGGAKSYQSEIMGASVELAHAMTRRSPPNEMICKLSGARPCACSTRSELDTRALRRASAGADPAESRTAGVCLGWRIGRRAQGWTCRGQLRAGSASAVKVCDTAAYLRPALHSSLFSGGQPCTCQLSTKSASLSLLAADRERPLPCIAALLHTSPTDPVSVLAGTWNKLTHTHTTL